MAMARPWLSVQRQLAHPIKGKYMQTFTEKTLAQSVLVGTLLAASVAAALVTQAQLKQVEADAAQLTQAEADFARLQADLARWQQALKTHAEVALRQEPLDLSVALPPEQLHALPPLLNKVFDPEGYFLLKKFRFEWKTGLAGVSAVATAAPLAHISLQGDRTLILKTAGVKP
jgi:septal ring factor EnvC (AmiA/AmiB activator)